MRGENTEVETALAKKIQINEVNELTDHSTQSKVKLTYKRVLKAIDGENFSASICFAEKFRIFLEQWHKARN